MRILIAEDDASIAEAVRFALTQAGHAVDAVSDGAAAEQMLRTHSFQLLILDVGLPGIDGFELLRRLRKRDSALPVLILSARDQPEEKATGLDLGADDYLAKPFSVSELQARVRALLRRGAAGASPVVTYGGLSFDTVNRTAAVNGATVPLSVHETGVLEALLRRFGRVVSKEQLVEQLYTYDQEISQNAIEQYIHRVRRKISGAGVAVRTVYGRGYVLEYAEQ